MLVPAGLPSDHRSQDTAAEGVEGAVDDDVEDEDMAEENVADEGAAAQ